MFLRMECADTVMISVKNGVVSPSILLPNLPRNTEEIWRGHKEYGLAKFTSYTTDFARMHLKDTSYRVLPYPQHEVGPDQANGYGGPGNIPSCFLRFPFVALPGHGDSFSSTRDLSSNIRAGVFMGEYAIPSLLMTRAGPRMHNNSTSTNTVV